MASSTTPDPENGSPPPPYRISQESSAPSYHTEVPPDHTRLQIANQQTRERDRHDTPTPRRDPRLSPRTNPNAIPDFRWDLLGRHPSEMYRHGSLEYANSRRQYENIAERRGRRFSMIELPPPAPSNQLRVSSGSGSRPSGPSTPAPRSGLRVIQRPRRSSDLDLSSLRPLYPAHQHTSRTPLEENPDVVGEEEARKARVAREMREIDARREEHLETENKSMQFWAGQENEIQRRRVNVGNLPPQPRKRNVLQRLSEEMKALGKGKGKDK